MLKKNYQYKQVLTKGKHYSGDYMLAYILKNNEKINYLGLAVSVKLRKSGKKK